MIIVDFIVNPVCDQLITPDIRVAETHAFPACFSKNFLFFCTVLYILSISMRDIARCHAAENFLCCRFCFQVNYTACNALLNLYVCSD